MSDTLFVDKITKIQATWLNDVNNTVYGKPTAVPNYSQAAAGAVARTINSRLNDIGTTPQDFGAIGDGASHPLSSITQLGNFNTTGWLVGQWQAVFPHVTALTNQIDWVAGQAALNTGLSVFWCDGGYLHDQPLTSTTYNQRLFGNGRLATLTFTLAAVGPGIIFKGSSGRQQVFGLNLVGSTNCNEVIQTQSPQIQVMFNWITPSISGSIGIYCVDENIPSNVYAFGAQICYNFIHGSFTTGSRGIRLGLNSQTSLIYGNTIDNFESSVSVERNTDSLVIEGNVFQTLMSTGYGVDMRSVASSSTYKTVQISGNHFEDVYGGIAWGSTGGSGATYTSNEIHSNSFNGHTGGTTYFLTVSGTCGAGCANNRVEYNDATDASGNTSVTFFFNLIDADGAASLMEKKGNTVALGAWATGAQSIYAYSVRQVNGYFGAVASTGSFVSQSVTRLEAGATTYRLPLRWEPGEYLESVQTIFLPNGSTPQVTITVYSGNGDTVASVATSGVITGTSGTKRLIIVPINTVSAQGFNYYAEFVHTLNGGTSAYDYPTQLYFRS